MYQAPYNIFQKAYLEVREALLSVCLKGNYEDAAFCPAVLRAAADMAVISESTDDELIDQFKKCLFDARTQNLLKTKQ